jgi:hypothetical protein
MSFFAEWLREKADRTYVDPETGLLILEFGDVVCDGEMMRVRYPLPQPDPKPNEPWDDETTGGGQP